MASFSYAADVAGRLLTGGAVAPIDDFGFVDREPVIIGGFQARPAPHCTVDVDHTTADAADEVVVVRPFRKLVADAAIFEGHAAEEFQVLEELDRAEHGCPTHARHIPQEVLDGEGPRRPFDGAKDRPARRGRTEADGFKPRRRRVRECHRAMVPNALIRAPENGR